MVVGCKLIYRTKNILASTQKQFSPSYVLFVVVVVLLPEGRMSRVLLSGTQQKREVLENGGVIKKINVGNMCRKGVKLLNCGEVTPGFNGYAVIKVCTHVLSF